MRVYLSSRGLPASLREVQGELICADVAATIAAEYRECGRAKLNCTNIYY
jgi:hypothetical protein